MVATAFDILFTNARAAPNCAPQLGAHLKAVIQIHPISFHLAVSHFETHNYVDCL
jgi:hypothetical protein